MGSIYDADFGSKVCQWPKSPWVYGIPYAVGAQQILTSLWRSLDSYPHSATCSLGNCEQVADKFPFVTYLHLWISLAPSISEIWAKSYRCLPFVYLSTAALNLIHTIGFFQLLRHHWQCCNIWAHSISFIETWTHLSYWKLYSLLFFFPRNKRNMKGKHLA